MKPYSEVVKNIHRLTLPYKDIRTSVFLIKTEKGALVFDAGSYDDDAQKYLVPFFKELGVCADSIKYIFVSHEHTDHAGGLCGFKKLFPDVRVVTGSSQLKLDFPQYDVSVKKDGDTLLDVLKIVSIPGHTKDCAAIFDTRTKTLVSGDCLQSYGIFGSGTWGANVKFPKEHIAAVDKVRNMDISSIIVAHDYHPYGYRYDGKESIEKALCACTAPIYEVLELISQNPSFDDQKIAELYNNPQKPTLGIHIVEAIRNAGIGTDKK